VRTRNTILADRTLHESMSKIRGKKCPGVICYSAEISEETQSEEAKAPLTWREKGEKWDVRKEGAEEPENLGEPAAMPGT